MSFGHKMITIKLLSLCASINCVNAIQSSTFTNKKLPDVLYEKDQASVIEEILADTKLKCAMRCEKIGCVAFLYKTSSSDTSRCHNSSDYSKYAGTWSLTTGNIPCQRWDAQSPHAHHWDPYYIPDTSLSAANNYCRDPSRSGYPWCYTSNPNVRWQTCNLFRCFGKGKNCRLYSSGANGREDVDGYCYFTIK